MPIDLPVRKLLETPAFLQDATEPLMFAIGAICFMVAVAGLISHTPRQYRDGLSAAVYEDMLQGP